MVAPHQRHRDADEAVAGGEVEQQPVVHPHHLVQPHHSRQRAGNRHRPDDVARRRDAGVDRCLRVGSDRAQLVAPAGMPDEDPHQHAAYQRPRERQVQRRAREVDPDPGEQLVHRRQRGVVGEGAALRRHLPRLNQHVHQQIDHQGGGDEVEHDGGDHHVRAALRLQVPRRPGPQRPAQGAAQHRQRRQQQERQPVQEQAHQADPEAAYVALPLAADVEQSAMQRHRDRQRGEDEVGGVIERVAPRLAKAEGAAHQAHQRLHRAFAQHQDHDPRNRERRQQVDQRQQRGAGPARQAGAGIVGRHLRPPRLPRPRPSARPRSVPSLPRRPPRRQSRRRTAPGCGRSAT